MSTYDMLPRGSQIKLWDCEFKNYKISDSVPSFGLQEYIVLLVEGGYVSVKNGFITKIVENKYRKAYYPEDFPGKMCLNKWGSYIKAREDLENINIFGGNYYWWEKKI